MPRYVAYTSDIGESFRPVAHPRLVTAAYGISWTYILGDVAFESWKARQIELGQYVPGLMPWHEKPEVDEKQAKLMSASAPDWRFVGAKRAVFQSVASMGLPALTIHSMVKYSGKAMKNVKNVKLRTFGPIGLGLAVVPALPYMFDEPVEHAVDYIFDNARDMINNRS